MVVDKLSDDREYVVVGYKKEEDCKTGGTSVDIPGWSGETTTYICGFSYSEQQSPQDNGSLYSKIEKLNYSTDCTVPTASALCLLRGNEENIISDPNTDGTYDYVFYYRGKDANNYLKIQGTGSADDPYIIDGFIS